MSAQPKLPPKRGKAKAEGLAAADPPPGHGPAAPFPHPGGPFPHPGGPFPPADLMMARARELASNPVLQRLAQSPETLRETLEKDPYVKQVLASNPGLQQMLQPDRMAAMMQFAADPSAALAASSSSQQQQQLLPGDLTAHRMSLMRLQDYARQMQGRPGAGAGAGAGAGVPWHSGPQPALAAEGVPAAAAGGANAAGHSVQGSGGSSGNSSQLLAQAEAMQRLQGSFGRLQQALLVSGGGMPPRMPLSFQPQSPLRPPPAAAADAGGAAAFSSEGAPGSSAGSGGRAFPPPMQALGFNSPHSSNAAAAAIGHGALHASSRGAEIQAAGAASAAGSAGSGNDGASAQEAYTGSYTFTHQEDVTIEMDLPPHLRHLEGQHILDPKVYYEWVNPSAWQPEPEESWVEAFRRAHCGYADALFPPAWFALAAALLWAGLLPFWALLLLLAVTFFAGQYVFTVLMSGVSSKAMATSRSLFAFIATCEVLYPLTYLHSVFPLLIWHRATATAAASAAAAAASAAAAAAAAAPAVAALAPASASAPPPASPPAVGAFWACLLLLCQLALPVVHIWLATSDPGYVPLGPPSSGPDSWDHRVGAGGAETGSRGGAGNSEKEADDSDGDGDDDEAQRQRRSLLGGGPPAATLPRCTTCQVERPLRSKHDPFTGRCIARFDHYCPAILNAVGEGNQRLFMTYLMLMALTQALTIAIFTSFIYAEYVSRAAEVGAMQGHGGQGDDATLWVLVLARALWHAPASHPALLLLAALQAPLLVAALIMAGRMGFGIAANVTVNEMVNRFRYSYLNHELAGYCNRFDRGVGPNCVQFWAPPRSAGRNGRYFRGIDWWSEFEAGERTMQASNSTLVRKWSLTLTIRALDAWRRRRRLLGK